MENIKTIDMAELQASIAIIQTLQLIFAKDGCKWPECTNNDTAPCWYRERYEDC